MDFQAFKKWVTSKGYTIDTSSKHHVLIDSQGNIVVRFAISHKKGGKRFVKQNYVSHIRKIIGP